MADALSEMPQQVGEDSAWRGQGFDNLSALGIANEYIRRTKSHGTLRGECTCLLLVGCCGLIASFCRYKDGSHLIHYGLTAHRATQSCYAALLNASLGKVPATCKAATAAVSTGQNSLNKVNARIFLHSKLTSHHIQQD